MVIKKDELRDWLKEKVQPFNIFNHETVAEIFETLLVWEDNEPRDINKNDLFDLEEFIATEVDRFLSSIEQEVSQTGEERKNESN